MTEAQTPTRPTASDIKGVIPYVACAGRANEAIDFCAQAFGAMDFECMPKVNPLEAGRFAVACGTQAKNDAADARILARMRAAPNLEPDTPTSEKQLVVGVRFRMV